MNEITIRLIEGDIKIARLVHLLGKDRVDARCYLPSSSRCVFEQLGIDENSLNDPNLQTQYMVVIDELASLDSGITIAQMRPYIEKICSILRQGSPIQVCP